MTELVIPNDGEWGETLNHYSYNSHIPRINYFVVMDCEGNLHAQDKRMPKIHVEMELKNEDYIN
jgi:hypothetical protein